MEPMMATHFTQAQLHGVPPVEIRVVSEVLNEADYDQQTTFGDLINGAVVRNFKAARLKDRAVSVRGLARVIGIQPSTLRRRIDQLVSAGWLERMSDGSVRYSQQSFDYGAPASRAMMHRFAASLQKAGWVDFRPPSD
ncbi:MAG: winged helix-turn-helix domain-containing protein [Devosia sp.]